mmetsp:Transcript_17488/g.17420  ORF Transcript_17488/g.17420 Transcript_17488/m.17420 type:complete len:228 (+) Transcript_17488:1270-1953(+)
MITPLPGVTITKPGSATLPFFGVDPAVLTDEGNETDYGTLAIRKPWPAMMRGIYQNPSRYVTGYWSNWGGAYYYTSDGAIKDQNGYYWIIGRLDDIVNVAGHRISTAELEGATITHPWVAESAFIGADHDIKGQALFGFVILKAGFQGSDQVRAEINEIIGRKLGRFEIPERLVFVNDLPKTRSGKIMRRLLRNIAERKELGNTSTLADPAVIDHIAEEFRKLDRPT